MICPLCQFQNSGEARFCAGCGQSLTPSGIGDLSLEATFLGEVAMRAGEGEHTVIADRYELLEELGRGGMGVVFKARDTKLGGRIVALKRLFSTDDKGTERFLREAAAIAALNHPGIRAIYDQAEDHLGPFLVMEYVEGESLQSYVRREGKLPDERFLPMARSLAEALAYAHGEGIIHRDVKPANVLLTQAGEPKLTDFGLARVGAASELSMTGQGMGTLDYAAPEQRENAKAVDQRSDIYGLGGTLYFMLTGETPKMVRLERVPERWRGLVMRCLEERAERRFSSADKVMAAVDEAARDALPDKGTAPTSS